MSEQQRNQATKPDAEKLPPHSVEAEQGVLGCCLLDPLLLGDVRQKLDGSAFYDLRHREIYHAALALHDDKTTADLIMLSQRLKDAGMLEECGGLAYLMQCMNSVPSAANLGYYLEILHEKWQRRRLLATCAEAMRAAYESENTVAERLIAEVADDLQALVSKEGEGAVRGVKEIVPAVIDEMEKYHRAGAQLQGLATGFSYLDKVLGGVRTDGYYVLAARPGDGKTALALNMAEYLSQNYKWKREAGTNPDGTVKFEEGTGIPVAIFSVEMTGQSLTKRLMFSVGHVSLGKTNTGFVTNEAVSRLATAAGRVSRMPIIIDESEELNIGQLRSRARKMARQHGIKLFILDYIQLIQGDGRQRDELERLKSVSRGIRKLKKELGIPWLVLCQMNRAMEVSDRTRYPMLSDLKGCGDIEQDADAVMFLFRPQGRQLDEKFTTENGIVEQNANEAIKAVAKKLEMDWDETPIRIDLFVAKNRHGGTGPVKMLFQKNFTRFEDWREWTIRHGLQKQADGEKKPGELGV